jgi:hypothetical protein
MTMSFAFKICHGNYIAIYLLSFKWIPLNMTFKNGHLYTWTAYNRDVTLLFLIDFNYNMRVPLYVDNEYCLLSFVILKEMYLYFIYCPSKSRYHYM